MVTVEHLLNSYLPLYRLSNLKIGVRRIFILKYLWRCLQIFYFSIITQIKRIGHSPENSPLFSYAFTQNWSYQAIPS
jgi:hypothetical protein